MSSMSVDTSVTSYIDENNCIGCAKCTKACPNDAIIGLKKPDSRSHRAMVCLLWRLSSGLSN